MEIQCFLNFGNICHIYFRDMGYFSKLLKGYGILGSPLPGPHYYMLLVYVPAICQCMGGSRRGAGGSDHLPTPLENHKLLYVSLEILARRVGGVRLSMKYVDD